MTPQSLGVTALSCLLALGGCNGAAPEVTARADRKQKLLDESARRAYADGDFIRSAQLFDKCLIRAYLRDDANAIVDAADRLKVVMGAVGGEAAAPPGAGGGPEHARPFGGSMHGALGSSGKCLLEHHHGHDGLAPLLVGYADDRHLGDCGVFVEDVLDLGRIDVDTARDEHVL